MSLTAAADAYYVDAAAFLTAFGNDPCAAILTLRDNPTAYGLIRNYQGAAALKRLHTDLLTAARRAWKAQDPAANIHATHRARNKPKTR